MPSFSFDFRGAQVRISYESGIHGDAIWIATMTEGNCVRSIDGATYVEDWPPSLIETAIEASVMRGLEWVSQSDR
ncbi:hypothetical protein [Dyella amyloliquefaciens]|uniref:hypothetical protein n=1 Tax=Dyella amyloliquefaciens TaxID=1770545 RepID=UPI00102EB2EE|nr:hypothetical protein [Dyella amyloliquefaciens]